MTKEDVVKVFVLKSSPSGVLVLRIKAGEIPSFVLTFIEDRGP